jgi:CheY-like chemotaxis protein
LTNKWVATSLFFNLTTASRERAECPDLGAGFPVLSLKQNRFGTLKRVSDKLTKWWTARADHSLNEIPLPHLLVVDDEEAICFSMSEYFSLHGYKVDTAREIEEAEQLLGASEYKVVIQDLRLSSTNNSAGFEMIRTIREHHPPTRIIVLTADGSAEVEDEARRCGADAFLRKPKPLSQVAQVVKSLIESIESPPKQGAKPANTVC